MPKEEPATDDVISVEGLECRFGPRIILHDITFSVRRNEIFFITGRSGCGKSTLLRHMVGLYAPAAGKISYFGKELTGADHREREELFKSFGVLFQEGALWSDMKLGENVELPLALRTRMPRRMRSEIAGFKLAQVGLAGYRNHYPNELSGGMRKRAALARALALDPSILFFDEPTAGLDPITARQIDHLIMQARETVGATIVVVSHSVSSIRGLADRMLLLDAETKTVAASGTPEELQAQGAPAVAREFFRMDAVKEKVEAG